MFSGLPGIEIARLAAAEVIRMPIRNRLPATVLVAFVVVSVAACSGSAATPSAAAPGQSGSPATAPSATEAATVAVSTDLGDPYANVDVCGLATTAEVTAVMGEQAHDPQDSIIGPGAGIDGAHGCTWQLGDSIDLFDVWIYPAASSDLKTALGQFWGDGYSVEPLSGYGDEAFAAVWRGDPAIRTVGQVAGVGVRQGDKAVLLSTLLIGSDYTDAKPAAQLAVKILSRF
jgi:hypothetical protein